MVLVLHSAWKSTRNNSSVKKHITKIAIKNSHQKPEHAALPAETSTESAFLLCGTNAMAKTSQNRANNSKPGSTGAVILLSAEIETATQRGTCLPPLKLCNGAAG